jgi:hypothetical protein
MAAGNQMTRTKRTNWSQVKIKIKKKRPLKKISSSLTKTNNISLN